MSSLTLPLQNLADRHPGLTPEIAACYYQAACICLSQHHVSPITFTISTEDASYAALAAWETPSQRQRDAWANQTDVTELGAYACALAAIELVCGLIAVKRAEATTGADYFLAPAGKPIPLAAAQIKGLVRLEISGTHLTKQEVESRLRRKLKQAEQGQSRLPALAAVVGFQVGQIIIHKLGVETYELDTPSPEQ